VSTIEARTRIIEELGVATTQIGLSMAALAAAHELLDDASADRLDGELFRPLRRAYAQAKRARSGFGERHGLAAPEPEVESPGLPSQGVKSLVERAAVAAGEGSRLIAELQDSMLPIEAGDPELRAALAETRELVDGLALPAQSFLRTLGR
jgi:hypothetical protein